jgi:acylphosphatase
MHYKILVKGRVQGVFFRASTQEKAEALHLSGFVQNEPNGDVYIEAQGQQVDELIDWIKAGGPKSARVDEAIISEGEGQMFIGFKIKH